MMRTHQNSAAQNITVIPINSKIHAVREFKADITRGMKGGAISLQIKSILTITELTCVRPYGLSVVMGPTKAGTQSLSMDNLLLIDPRSWTTFRQSIDPNRRPFWKLENGPSEGPVTLPVTVQGQNSQHIYEPVMPAWLKQIVISSVRSRDGERSTQFPTADEKSNVTTEDVMPLEYS